MKKNELKTICDFVRHCERVLLKHPPPSTDNVAYNCYRMARYKELPKIKKILNDSQNNLHHEQNTDNKARTGMEKKA